MHFPIKVLDLELSQPVDPIAGLDGYTKVLFLVRLFNRPIGYVTLPVNDGKVSTAALINTIIAKHGYTIMRSHVYNALIGNAFQHIKNINDFFELCPETETMASPFVSIVVCTRNRTADLALCLTALSKLTYQNLEIIVVDNAPTDGATEELVKNSYKDVRYVCEPRPGLDWARNRGIKEAKGEIIAYTDDDVIVDEAWINAIATLFEENKDVMAATGLVVPFEMETRAQVLFEEYGGFGRGFYRKWIRVVNQKLHWGYLGAGQFGTGANMAFRRSVFEKVGLFDPALDVGTVTNGGGDLEMYLRVIKEGFTLVYEPGAVVRHRHRRELVKLKEQLHNNGKGLFSYFSRTVQAYPELKMASLRLTYWWLVHWIGKKLLKTFIRKSTFPRELIMEELKGSFNSIGLYKKARKKAVQIAGQYGNVNDVNVDQPKGNTNVLKTKSRDELPAGKRKINIMKPLQPVEDIKAFAKVLIAVYKDETFIGEIEIANNFQELGIPCIADAIADKLSYPLLQSFYSTAFELDNLIDLLKDKFTIAE